MTPGWQVRTARPDELAAVGALTLQVYSSVPGYTPEPEYEAQLADSEDRALTCEIIVAAGEDDALLAGVTYVPGPGPYAEFDEPDWAGIRMLAVVEHARGQGVGGALMRACLDRAEHSGRAGVALHTTSAMTEAARLYPRLGFTRAPDRDFSTQSGEPLLGYAWRNPDRDRLDPTNVDQAELVVAVVDGDDPTVTELVAALDAELALRYGKNPCPDLFSPSQIDERGRVLLAHLDGAAVGTATMRARSATDVELKRMMVAPAARGAGVGSAILTHAEETARGLGYRRMVLETGTRQPEAMRMYRRFGFTPIAPYGHYRDSPRSRCFAKDL